MVMDFLISATIGAGITDLLTRPPQRPGDQQKRFKQAESLLNQQRYKEALAILDQLIKENPTDPQYYAYLVICYDHLKDVENRLQNIEKALDAIKAVFWLAGRGVSVPQNARNALAQRQKELELLWTFELVRSLDTPEEQPRSEAKTKPKTKAKTTGYYSRNKKTKEYRCEYCFRDGVERCYKTLSELKKHVSSFHGVRCRST